MTDLRLPRDEATEAAVLGAMLIEPKAAQAATETLTPTDFYLPRHRLLFKLFAELCEKQPDLDVLFVQSELARRGLSERVGGKEIIGYLIEQCPSAANVERYCRILKEKTTQRSAMLAAAELTDAAQRGDTTELVATIRAAADKLDIGELAQAADPKSVGLEVEAEIAGTRKVVAFPGWPALTSTFLTLPSTVGVLCGDAGASKSLLATEAVLNVFMAGEPAAILHLESGGNFHLRRVQAMLAGLSEITNPLWVKAHPEGARAVQADVVETCEKLLDGRVIQYLADAATPKNLLFWLRRNVDKRVVVIDPISKIDFAETRHIGTAQRRFLDGAKKIVEKSGQSLILVNHPPDLPPGAKRVPGRMGGSKALENFTDVILDLEWHEPLMGEFRRTGLSPVSGNYNRTLHVKKVRSVKRYGRAIGFWLNPETLRHTELGWLE